MKVLLDLSSRPQKNQNGADCACSACAAFCGMSDEKAVPPALADIICERDKRHSNHYGNRVFRDVIYSYREQYSRALSKDDKMKITKEILHVLRTKHKSRFIKQNQEGGWDELSERHARDKVGHALRFALKPRGKRGRPPTKTAARDEASPKKRSKPGPGGQPPMNLICGTSLATTAITAPSSPSAKSVGSRDSSCSPASSSSAASKRLRAVAHAALDRAAALVLDSAAKAQSALSIRQEPISSASSLSEFGENSVGSFPDHDMQQFLFRHWDVEKEDLNHRGFEVQQPLIALPSAMDSIEHVSFYPLLDHELDTVYDIPPTGRRDAPSRIERPGTTDGPANQPGVLHDDLRALTELLREPFHE